MLELKGLDVSYGTTQVLWEIDLNVAKGEIVAVMGPNGSGKSTIFKTVMGIVRSTAGTIFFEGRDISRLPTHEMVAQGISLVLERRRLFPMMTVHENVIMGAYHKATHAWLEETLEWVESLFPILRERRNQIAGQMSGGEQQMVAVARGLMSRPKLLIMDEPFLGLSPKMVDVIVKIIKKVNAEGIAVLFNEQNVYTSFSNSHRGYVLESGRVVVSGSGIEMLENPDVRRVYLGQQTENEVT